jgi:large subunit ribosomal protein L17
MRHGKRRNKLNRTSSHRSCMISNMLKDLIDKERIVTTIAKAKELRRHADKMVTIAKTKGEVNGMRAVSSALKLQYNSLTPKEKRAAKQGDTSAYNTDRVVLKKLFGDLKTRYQDRQGGYTRIIKKSFRIGDDAPTCIIEYVQ